MRKRSYGTGHYEERGDNRWLIRWRTPDGQKSKIVEGDAWAAQDELKRQCKPQPEAVKAERSFDSFLQLEWAQYTRGNWKRSTATTMGSMVTRHIAPFFGTMLLSAITPSTIAAFHRAMETKGLALRTRRNLHAIIAKMFDYAVETLELAERNPVKKGQCPREPGKKAKKPILTAPELAELFRLLPVRYRAFYLTLALTGIRTGEALGLRWEDVDIASAELHVRRAIYRGQPCTPKTPDSLRDRPMIPELQTALIHHKAMSAYIQPSDYIFTSNSGRPANPDSLRKTLQAALKGMGILFPARADGLHLLRHSSGSLVYRRSGGDMKLTQEWLGHSSIRTTADIYVHLGREQQQTTAANLAQGIFAQQEAPEIVH